ncbi:hypothetical protein MACH10_23340 [Thalassospira tepidiphila]|uniref:AAA family ATPase n=1 Tax=Thalassospira tepidiphila TaxID=393657 RepID=UPI0029238252|nr:hypothetical protein MACH10_23340 [Thalassospira tepidiphila]
MRYIKRSPSQTLEWFQTSEGREAARNQLEFFRKGTEAITQSRYPHLADQGLNFGFERRSTQALLEDFSAKCAFCESPVNSEEAHFHRFRPSFGAEPAYDKHTAHLYYTWLHFAWQNIYLICEFCTPEDSLYFPVINKKRTNLPSISDLSLFTEKLDGFWPGYPLKEKNLLLDPCYDKDLSQHFRFLPNGEVNALTSRGAATIELFKLNRENLTENRKSVFSQNLTIIDDILENEADYLVWDLTQNPRAPFIGAWKILLAEVLSNVLNQKVSHNDLKEELISLSLRPDGNEIFLNAIDLVTHDTKRPPSQKRKSVPKKHHPNKRKGKFDFDTKLNLSKVTINNYKSLEKISISLPHSEPQEITAPSLMILGENAAGKSTILEAISISLMTEEQFSLLKLENKKLIIDPLLMGGHVTQPSTSSLKTVFATSRHDHFHESERILQTGRINKLNTEFIITNELPQSPPMFAYGAFRQFLDGKRRYAPHQHIRSLFQSNYLLSNPEDWLLKLNHEDFTMVARALREVLSIEGAYDVLTREKDSVFVVHSLGGGMDKTRQLTPLSVVSSGFRSILAMLCDVIRGLMDTKNVNPSFETLETTTGLVLIDEIEAHLHPRWKMSIMTGLRRALPRVTFIVTSHDPLCLRGMHKDEVVVLRRTDSRSSELKLPTSTQTVTDLPNNRNWTIEQLLTADFFNLRSTESIDAEKHRAEVERLIASGEMDSPQVSDYFDEIAQNLPIGSSEIQRLIQDAVADYLRERQAESRDNFAKLRKETRLKVLNILRDYQ